jgi:hypothetical protein
MSTNEQRRQQFLELWELGYSPIPMARGPVRKPLITNWAQYGDVRPEREQIEHWATLDCNIGLVAGKAHFVDIDDDLVLPELGSVLPPSPLGKRCNKGLTAFYRAPGLASRAMGRVLGGTKIPCVEFMGGGRVTTVWGIHGTTGKRYEWIGGLVPYDKLPVLTETDQIACEAVIQRRYGPSAFGLTKANGHSLAAPQPGGVIDGLTIAYARAALAGESEKVANAVPGGRANQLFASACALGKWFHRNVLPESEIVNALAESCRVNGLLSEEGLDSVTAQIQSGFSKAVNDILPQVGPTAAELFGSNATAALGPTATLGSTVVPFPICAVPFEMTDDGGLLPESAEEMIKDVLPAGAGLVCLMAGMSGAGKSFLMIELARAAASGGRFMDLPCRKPGSRGATFIMAAEGEGTLEERLYASKKSAGQSEPLPIVFMKRFPPLNTPGLIETIADRIKQKSAELYASGRTSEPETRIIFIDSLASAFGFDDLNNPGEAVKIIAVLKRLGELCDCPVMCVAHFGKSADAGISGSHQYRAQCDHALYVLAERSEAEGTVSNRRLILGRSRTGKEGALFGFDLQDFDLGLNRYGEPRVTAVPVRAVATTQVEDKPESKGLVLLKQAFATCVAAELAIERTTGPGVLQLGVNMKFLKDEFVRLYSPDNEPTGRQALHRTMKANAAQFQIEGKLVFAAPNSYNQE